MQSMYYLENFRTNRLVILKLFTKAKERIEMPKEYLLDTNAYYNLLKESREHQKGNSIFSTEINMLPVAVYSFPSLPKLRSFLCLENMPEETAAVFKNAPDAFPRRGTLVRISGIRDQKPVGTDGKSAAGKS